MQLIPVFYSVQINGKTVTRRLNVPATSADIAERMIRAWLQLQHKTVLSVVAET
ncbi:hypothetical protein GPEL0_01f1055 [Geoanaerobacter pelophilus]|uniref:Uncharacterized protein n=1 Tax=Geoanaerobacter pelophilus TaxID=60036 RepID=A0ABQ0MFV7_9BACT|nr:hypothetical protein GPEL0_01f1055 [Geoanaerobacter pelophilus]